MVQIVQVAHYHAFTRHLSTYSARGVVHELTSKGQAPAKYLCDFAEHVKEHMNTQKLKMVPAQVWLISISQRK